MKNRADRLPRPGSNGLHSASRRSAGSGRRNKDHATYNLAMPFSYETFPSTGQVAYFSMEIAIQPQMPTYSGGLGVLAGDTLRSAADLGVPLVAFTLLHRKGYFQQHLDPAGVQSEEVQPWNPADFCTEEPARVTVSDRRPGGDRARVALRPGGPLRARGADLPAGHRSGREFGMGPRIDGPPVRRGHELPPAAGDRAGHGRRAHGPCAGPARERVPHERGPRGAADAGAAGKPDWAAGRRARPPKRTSQLVRRKCVFTTHTPVPAGHDRFSTEQAIRILGGDRTARLEKLGCFRDGLLNMTLLALRFSRYANGVAMQHGKVSRAMFPEFAIDSITNGVHAPTWISRAGAADAGRAHSRVAARQPVSAQRHRPARGGDAGGACARQGRAAGRGGIAHRAGARIPRC